MGSDVTARPPTGREVELTGTKVGVLQDQTSLWFDLLRIRQYLTEVARLPRITDHGPVIFTRAALWDAAVVLYARLHNSGQRTRLTPLIKRLPSDLAAVHHELMSERNTEVAHHGHPTGSRAAAHAVIYDDNPEKIGVRVWVYPPVVPSDDQPFDRLVSELASLVAEQIDAIAQLALADVDLEACATRATSHDDKADGTRGAVRFQYEVIFDRKSLGAP